MDQAPNYGQDQGSEARAQGSNGWDRGSGTLDQDQGSAQFFCTKDQGSKISKNMSTGIKIFVKTQDHSRRKYTMFNTSLV